VGFGSVNPELLEDLRESARTAVAVTENKDGAPNPVLDVAPLADDLMGHEHMIKRH
jgi:hypothetical protein